MNDSDWAQLVLSWEAECAQFEENFEDYASASLPVLSDLANAAPRRDAGVFAIKTKDKFQAVCQANSSFLPGYTGKVLRIRHIVLSPIFDFSAEVEIDEYSDALIGMFTGAIELAYGEMPSDHLKFHLKSPAERTFGSAFTEAVQKHHAFEKVAMKGSWIYLSKA